MLRGQPMGEHFRDLRMPGGALLGGRGKNSEGLWIPEAVQYEVREEMRPDEGNSEGGSAGSRPT
eukprot:984820-Rhodomonas_salina.1